MSDMDDIEFEIGIMEDRIDQAKQDSAQAEGAINAHMERLKSDFGLASEKEIEVFINKGEKELAKEELAITKSFTDIKDRYDDQLQ